MTADGSSHASPVAIEKQLIKAYLHGDRDWADSKLEVLSTGQQITVCLATGQDGKLPAPYRNFRDAWRRLGDRERRIVLETVMWADLNIDS